MRFFLRDTNVYVRGFDKTEETAKRRADTQEKGGVITRSRRTIVGKLCPRCPSKGRLETGN